MRSLGADGAGQNGLLVAIACGIVAKARSDFRSSGCDITLMITDITGAKALVSKRNCFIRYQFPKPIESE
jgi:hypothetical protein